MTKVVIEAGICGYTITVEATKLSRRRVRVTIAGDCDMVNQMNSQLWELDWRDALKPPEESVVYKCASKHIRHVACPVPMAIMKAIEAEVGAALPKDVAVRFETASDR
jgi:hypothetical protein